MNPRQYAQIIYDALLGKTEGEQTQIISRFKTILIKNKDTHLFEAIEKELKKIQEQKEQEKTTYITTASELSDKQKIELENLFSKPLNFSENPTLIGGVAVRQKDKVQNATLKKKIEAIKSSI